MNWELVRKYGFWILLVGHLIWAIWFFGFAPKVVNSYPLLDPARNFIGQKNFIVNLQPLREELHKLVDSQKDKKISLYFEFLNTGANISINQDLKVWPASFPKVPMAMAAVKKAEKGDWPADKKFKLMESDRDSNYGVLYKDPIGTEFYLDDLLRETLVYSDNTAYWMLLRNIDKQDLDLVVSDLGLQELFTVDGLVSAKEYSRLFRSLYVSSFLKRENSEKILNLLARSSFNSFLGSGLPSEVVFSHKFGVDNGRAAYLDSGIVYFPERPFLLSVAVRGDGGSGEQSEVEKFMGNVAAAAYRYISEY